MRRRRGTSEGRRIIIRVLTLTLSGNSLEIPLIDFTLSAIFAGDATFPFMEMNFLSAISLASGLLHALLLGIIIYSAWPGASSPFFKKDLRPSKLEEQCAILACLPLFRLSSGASNPPMNDLFHPSIALSSFEPLPRRDLIYLPLLLLLSTVPLLKRNRTLGCLLAAPALCFLFAS